MRLPVGKYRNVDLSQITDIAYLKWAMDNMEPFRNVPTKALYKRIREMDPEYVSLKRGKYEEWIT